MKKTILLASFISVFYQFSYGQNPDSLFIDNNPKLTGQESKWLNEKFPAENFDFTNKFVGFVDLQTGGLYGIGKIVFPMQKKKLKQVLWEKLQHKLIVLDTAQKKVTHGYDALLVLIDKKHIGKLERLNIEKLIDDTRNVYPQFPTDAGKDNNPVLNESNAMFFNAIYDPFLGFYQTPPKENFNFEGKKVAIFDNGCVKGKPNLVTISAYVKKVQEQLDRLSQCWTDMTYYLNQEQKMESGGYDVIIVYYQLKPCFRVEELIKKLRQN
jgi:hypothetical protein